MAIEPQTHLAIDFLTKLRPNGPWILTAILPDKGKIFTRTFVPDELPEMACWIDSYQGIRNLYYTLNSVRELVEKKPEKSQISELIALHCDLDPRIGEDFAEERIRILKTVASFTPKPSVIVDSGNGYQVIFFLRNPVPLDGSIETVEEYERYNRQLELLLSGDSCHNCDRILRLPGTINVPDEKKKKRGRILTLSKVVEWNDSKYQLSEFMAAPVKVQTSYPSKLEQLPGGEEKIRISGNIAPLYVEDLEKRGLVVPGATKVLIIYGTDVDDPHKYPSRSEALFAVVCSLVKAGADDDTIAGIIMNRENKISESVLDKTRPEKYAAKQIQSAKEEIEDPLLRKLNSRFAVIGDLGGKCRIISEAYDYALKRSRISFSTFEDFKNRFSNQRVQIASDADGKPIWKAAGQWWINNPQRRQYDTIVFAPGREVPEAYNLWQGFACEAIPGDCEIFLEHVRKNLCKNNLGHYQYMLGWMARCVQQPDCPGEVAIVLRGEQGTGKGAFAKHFGSLFGRHFLQVSDPKHLVGSFNSHLRDCILLLADEAFYAGDKKHESVLKSLVTEATISVEAKGVDVISCPNYTHIILASNSAWVVPAGTNERRFFVLDVSSDKMQDKKYFAAIQEQMNRGGKEALLYFLLTFDISNFEVRDVPKTEALQDQKLLSYSPEESWWFEKLEEGRILKEHDCWEREVMKQSLQDDYINFMHRVGIIRKASPTVLGKFLGRVCPNGVPRSYQRMAKVKSLGPYGEEFFTQRRVYFYELPNLEECRLQWDTHLGGPFKWNQPLEKGEQMNFKPPESVFE